MKRARGISTPIITLIAVLALLVAMLIVDAASDNKPKTPNPYGLSSHGTAVSWLR